MKNQNLRGTGVAVVTPFTKEGKVDFTSLEKILRHIIDGGVEYLVMLGTTGESVTLEKEEKADIISFAKQIADNKLPVVVGLGGNNTSALLKDMEKTNWDGVEAILSVSPYYNKPTQKGILMHYKELAKNAPCPILLYNVPGRTASNLTAETTLELAEEKNIAGIKEASGNIEQCMQIISQKPDDFLVISGDDAITLPLISIGMDGVISVVANSHPKDFSEMVRLALAGNFEEARKLHYKLLPAMIALFKEGNPGGIKAMLNILGLCENELRLPCAPVSENLYQELQKLS